MLSVTIICKNEEKNIKDCLTSVSFADEIIIVDSGSTDKTLDICSQFTDKIHSQEWLGMNKQKEFALSKASEQWVLNIDADERLSAELVDEIKQIIETDFDHICGYYIPRNTFYLGKWLKYGPWVPEYKLRLFKRGSGKWTGTDPHDVVTVKGEILYLKNPLLHYSFENLAEHWQSTNNHSTIAAQEAFNKNQSSSFSTIISHTFFSFIKSYVLKKGFLEGTRGLIQAMMISYGVTLKYAKLWEIQHTVRSKSDKY